MTETTYENPQAVGGASHGPSYPARLKTWALIAEFLVGFGRFVVICWALAVLFFSAVPTLSLFELSGLSWGFQCDAVAGGGQWCTFVVDGPVELGAPGGGE